MSTWKVDIYINFPNVKLRPKHHFLKHYPRLIMEFGPLIHLWTLQFESTHCFFKKCIKSAQNFKNVCQTFSEKHQLLQAYKQASNFFQNELYVKRSIPLTLNTYIHAIQLAMQNSLIAEGAEISLEVIIKGTHYRKEGYVVLRAHEAGFVFGQIRLNIITSSRIVHFLVKESTSDFSEELHAYILPSDNSTVGTFNCIEYSKLLDYYPLSAYKRGTSLLIPLKHAISTEDFFS